jgi:hypothetical protein
MLSSCLSVGAAISVAGGMLAAVAVSRSVPSPEAYMRRIVVEPGDPYPTSDPHAEVRFNNMAHNRMRIEDMHYLSDNQRVPTLRAALELKSADRLQLHEPARPRLLPVGARCGDDDMCLGVVRPEAADDPTWETRLSTILAQKNVHLVVNYKYMDIPGLFGGLSATKECRVR